MKTKKFLRRTKEYVHNVIFSRKYNQDEFRTRFVPNRKQIRNIILRVKLQKRRSTIDPENVEQLCSHWKKWSHMYFEASTKDSIINEKVIEVERTDDVEPQIKNEVRLNIVYSR